MKATIQLSVKKVVDGYCAETILLKELASSVLSIYPLAVATEAIEADVKLDDMSSSSIKELRRLLQLRTDRVWRILKDDPTLSCRVDPEDDPRLEFILEMNGDGISGRLVCRFRTREEILLAYKEAAE